MRAHLLDQNGKIVNTLIVDALDCMPGLIDADKFHGDIGDSWANGVFTPAQTPMPTVADYTDAIQNMLDTTAQEHGYDGILSACSYASSSVARFRAEGLGCFEWRDAVWNAAAILLKSVETAQMQQPTIAAMLAMLPKMEWPNG